MSAKKSNTNTCAPEENISRGNTGVKVDKYDNCYDPHWVKMQNIVDNLELKELLNAGKLGKYTTYFTVLFLNSEFDLL